MILTRNIEFSMYNTCFAGMSGQKVYKKIKKPEDLYRLSSDPKPEVLKGDEANNFLQGIAKKK